MNFLLNCLFGCRHEHLSFPQSTRKSGTDMAHVTCLDCGKEFRYDWDRMKICKMDSSIDWEVIREL